MIQPDPLAADDQRRLETALGSSRPLPASNAEECGELLRRPVHRVTAADHQAFRESLATPARSFDEIDHAVGDPLTERFLRPRKESQAARVLLILDELQRDRRSA